MNIHLGTQDSGYEFLAESEARNEPTNPAIAREGTFQLGFSHGITVNVSGKYLLPSSLAVPFDDVGMGVFDMIEDSYQNASIMYNEGARLGCLVPELSLIYHCILAWAAAQSAFRDIRDQVLDKVPKLDPSPDGARVAADKLRACGELEIRPKFQTDDAYTLDAAFKSAWKQFQSRKRAVELRMQQELRSMRTNILPLANNSLSCWDLYDLVKRRNSFRRQISLNPNGGRWYEIARDNTDVLIFIYRHNGNDCCMPIRPYRQMPELCDDWTVENLTKRKSSYLLASVRCIDAITRPKSGPSNISSHHFCGQYPDNKVFECCDFSSQSSSCNRVQSLEKAAPDRALEIDQATINGAVLFGKNLLSKRRPCRRAIRASEMMAPSAGSIQQSRAPLRALATALNSRPAHVATGQAPSRQVSLPVRSDLPPSLPSFTLNSAGPTTDLRGTHFDISHDSDEDVDDNNAHP